MAAPGTWLVLLTVGALLMVVCAHGIRERGTGLSSFERQTRDKRFIVDYKRDVNVKYFLHTRETGATPTVLETNTPDLSGTTYRNTRPTKFIVHGFLNGGDQTWVVDMATALLQAEDLNVFAVDWEEGASGGLTGLNYLQAQWNTRSVGQSISQFVNHLGQSMDMIHIIGHSLGAHAAGFAGKALQEGGQTVGRISGLDPAGPRFRSVSPPDRLDKTDAVFVDVIHTEKHWVGMRQTLGHVDFYPNEGWLQPGCTGYVPGIGKSCSHSRAHMFFTESIASECTFNAYRCQNWDTFNRDREQCDICGGPNSACSEMGYHSINYPDSHGTMYLVTSKNHPPHCSSRKKREADGYESEQCVQSLDSAKRQEIKNFFDSVTDMKEMGLQEDFCSLYSNMETAVANMTESVPNCGPDDIPDIMEYIADAKYDAVDAWGKDYGCPTSGVAFTFPAVTIITGLHLIVVLTMLDVA